MARISSRRDFLRKTAALTGGTVAASAAAAPLSVPPSTQEPGQPIPDAMERMPSKEQPRVAGVPEARVVGGHVRNRHGMQAWSATDNGDVRKARRHVQADG